MQGNIYVTFIEGGDVETGATRPPLGCDVSFGFKLSILSRLLLVVRTRQQNDPEQTSSERGFCIAKRPTNPIDASHTGQKTAVVDF